MTTLQQALHNSDPASFYDPSTPSTSDAYEACNTKGMALIMAVLDKKEGYTSNFIPTQYRLMERTIRDRHGKERTFNFLRWRTIGGKTVLADLLFSVRLESVPGYDVLYTTPIRTAPVISKGGILNMTVFVRNMTVNEVHTRNSLEFALLEAGEALCKAGVCLV